MNIYRSLARISLMTAVLGFSSASAGDETKSFNMVSMFGQALGLIKSLCPVDLDCIRPSKKTRMNAVQFSPVAAAFAADTYGSKFLRNTFGATAVYCVKDVSKANKVGFFISNGITRLMVEQLEETDEVKSGVQWTKDTVNAWNFLPETVASNWLVVRNSRLLVRELLIGGIATGLLKIGARAWGAEAVVESPKK